MDKYNMFMSLVSIGKGGSYTNYQTLKKIVYGISHQILSKISQEIPLKIMRKLYGIFTQKINRISTETPAAENLSNDLSSFSKFILRFRRIKTKLT